MKTWLKLFFAKLKVAICDLYANVWFTGLSMILLGAVMLFTPAVGATLWFVWIVGWLFLAEK